jgi:predicted ArsR family transcriptional regulator
VEGRPKATDEEARALASSLRMRILRVCLSEPHTNKEIATVLGRDPATILHHVRLLTRTGFLAAQAERRGARGAREIPYLATRKSWSISTPAMGRVLIDSFLEEVALIPAEQLDTSRLGVRLNAENRKLLNEKLNALLSELEQTPEDEDGEPWSIFVALHPDPNRKP